jgi:serpin B
MKLQWLNDRMIMMGVLLTLLLTGCSGSGESGATAPVSSSKSRNLAPVAVQSTESAVVAGSDTLGLDLLSRISGNGVVAPFSASLSLAQLRAGAKGETLTAINGAMHLSGLETGVDSTFNGLDLWINGRLTAAQLGTQTSQANAGAWAQARYGYLLSYLDTLAENYGLKPSRIDFALAPGNAWQTVYDWTTLSSGLSTYTSLTQDTRLVLGNTVRFNAAWAEPFDPALTTTSWFQPLDTYAVNVPFMRRTANLPHTSGNGYSAVALGLAAGQQMLVVLPDEGRFAEIQTALTTERLKQIATALTPAQVDLALPKFAIVSTIPIDLGVAATKYSADFSGLDGTKDLYVSATEHRTTLSVTEAGLQAGSATLLALEDAHPETWTNPGTSGVILGQDTISSPPEIDVILGRPFIFAVRDSATGAILFLGRVMNPKL